MQSRMPDWKTYTKDKWRERKKEEREDGNVEREWGTGRGGEGAKGRGENERWGVGSGGEEEGGGVEERE